MSRRKTAEVGWVKMAANQLLKDSLREPAFRDGVCALIENVLTATGNYQGFCYLKQDEVPQGHCPGITWGEDGEPSFTGCDKTRRFYY
jgi:hypothetical protein